MQNAMRSLARSHSNAQCGGQAYENLELGTRRRTLGQEVQNSDSAATTLWQYTSDAIFQAPKQPCWQCGTMYVFILAPFSVCVSKCLRSCG